MASASDLTKKASKLGSFFICSECRPAYSYKTHMGWAGKLNYACFFISLRTFISKS